ncbi:MAG: hypothetical protein GWP19_03890 [Planctomycetia bacterium]|nr:hypothetical protein [Planctomycetia bacterium]
MKILNCESYKTWTDFGYEYGCDYESDVSCEDCVCSGGEFDPRYDCDRQPHKLSNFIIYTKRINKKRIIAKYKLENK